MKYYTLFFYIVFVIYNSMNAQTIVFFNGTTRSGKSSICKEIQKHAQWGAIGSLYFDYLPSVLKVLFKPEYNIIKKGIKFENLRHAITRSIFLFNDNISNKTKKEILQAISKIQNYFNNKTVYTDHKKKFESYCIKKLYKNFEKYNFILADVSRYVRIENIKQLKSQPHIFSVLVYCPFPVIIERLLNTNKASLQNNNLMNYRFFIEALVSFFSLYDLKADKKNAVDYITKNQLSTCFDIIEQNLSCQKIPNNTTTSGFMLHEISAHQLQKYKVKILAQFNDNEVLYIVPKKKYDLILKTHIYTTQMCVKQINKLIKH